MWESDPGAFAEQFGLSTEETKLLQSTAEHLTARCDGGTNSRKNIAAACLACNRARHSGRSASAPDPIAYATEVLRKHSLQVSS
jgi:5-methylcytosine-specific restriction endonuclease McrA